MTWTGVIYESFTTDLSPHMFRHTKVVPILTRTSTDRDYPLVYLSGEEGSGPQRKVHLPIYVHIMRFGERWTGR